MKAGQLRADARRAGGLPVCAGNAERAGAVGADRRALLRHDGRAHRARPRVPPHRRRGVRRSSRSSTKRWRGATGPARTSLGKRVRLDSRDGAWAEIVGVAARQQERVHRDGPAGDAVRAAPAAPQRRATLLVHTTGASESVAGPIRDIVHSLDADMPVFGVRTMEDFYYWRATYIARLISGSVAVMGAMGVTLAVVGLYGLVAYAASRRTREIGIRMAIGAQPRAVLRMVLAPRIRAVDLRPRGRGRWQPGDRPPAASRAQRPRTRRRRRRRRHDADRRASAGVGDAARDLRAGAPRRAHRSARSP